MKITYLIMFVIILMPVVLFMETTGLVDLLAVQKPPGLLIRIRKSLLSAGKETSVDLWDILEQS